MLKDELVVNWFIMNINYIHLREVSPFYSVSFFEETPPFLTENVSFLEYRVKECKMIFTTEFPINFVFEKIDYSTFKNKSET